MTVLAKLPFRSKLVLVVSVPLLVLILFAGVAIKGRFDALDAQEQYGQLVGPFQSLTAVARSVANEGVASESFVGGQPGSQEMLDQARAATDVAVASLRADVGSLSGTVSDETAETAELVAADLDERVATYRRAVDGGSAWVGFFSPIAREALGSATEVARDTDDRTLAAGLGTVLDLDRRQVALSDESAIVMHYFRYASADGDIGPVIASTGAGPWVDAIAQEQAGTDGFAESATDAQLEANAAAGGNNLLANPIRSDSFDGNLPSSLTVAPADYLSFYSRQQGRLDEGRRAVQGVVNDTASAQQADARTETYLVALGTALVILIVLALTWAIVKAVNRPLRALTRAARDVSERRLPRLVDTLHRGGELTPDQLEEMAPIRVESQDEIGELAKAFSTIQQVTVSVAEEQSELLSKGIGDLYVNLARRNQSLLDRQISLLDDMEAKVEHADELSSLFKLDHLATRMRRNAESLLVLSGAEQPRQWGSAIARARRGARGRGRDRRLRPRRPTSASTTRPRWPATPWPTSTHLLAELLENATSFSPPQTPVVVAGRAVDRRFMHHDHRRGHRHGRAERVARAEHAARPSAGAWPRAVAHARSPRGGAPRGSARHRCGAPPCAGVRRHRGRGPARHGARTGRRAGRAGDRHGARARGHRARVGAGRARGPRARAGDAGGGRASARSRRRARRRAASRGAHAGAGGRVGADRRRRDSASARWRRDRVAQRACARGHAPPHPDHRSTGARSRGRQRRTPGQRAHGAPAGHAPDAPARRDRGTDDGRRAAPPRTGAGPPEPPRPRQARRTGART